MHIPLKIAISKSCRKVVLFILLITIYLMEDHLQTLQNKHSGKMFPALFFQVLKS